MVGMVVVVEWVHVHLQPLAHVMSHHLRFLVAGVHAHAAPPLLPTSGPPALALRAQRLQEHVDALMHVAVCVRRL
jgi:hypothetical protein